MIRAILLAALVASVAATPDPGYPAARPRPSSHYGAPAKPKPTYGAPRPPPSYGAPSKPKPTYGAPRPAPSYGAPSKPKPSYGAPPPAPSYGAPPKPAPSYGAPPPVAPSYGPPPAPKNTCPKKCYDKTVYETVTNTQMEQHTQWETQAQVGETLIIPMHLFTHDLNHTLT